MFRLQLGCVSAPHHDGTFFYAIINIQLTITAIHLVISLSLLLDISGETKVE